MNQDNNTNNENDSIEVEIEKDNNDSNTMTDTSDNNQQGASEDAPVVINKSSNKLALFLSLLALVMPAYLLYLEFLTEEKPQNHSNLEIQFQSLSTTNQQLQQQLTDQKQQNTAAIQDLQQQIDRLKQQPSPQANDADEIAFDNSANEAAIARIESQLNQQMQNQAEELQQLQNQLTQTIQAQNSSNSAKEVLPDPVDRYDSRRAIDALYAADLLFRTQRLPQAISTLQQLLNTAQLRTQTQQSINQLIHQWQQIEQPDTQALMSQLQQIKTDIRQLKLATIANKNSADENSETPWYSRFVSVKKIDTDSQLSDSNALHLLQAELTQQLLQAEWALTLNQSDAWQAHLSSAAKRLTTAMPEQKQLIQSLQRLASEHIVALLPTPSGIHDLISELKGQR